MHIILKADDLKLGHRDEAWRAFFELLRRRDLPGSAGVIGGPTLAHHRTDPAAHRWVLPYLEQIELWNHGLDHDAEEFRGRPATEQAQTIGQAQAAIETVFGVRPSAFGAPFNFFDQGTIDACEQVGMGLVFATGSARNTRLVARDRVFSFETSRFVVHGRKIANPNLQRFKRRFRDVWSRGGVAVLQVHPTRWDRDGLRRFGTVLDTLKTAGCAFLKPSDVLAGRYPEAMTAPRSPGAGIAAPPQTGAGAGSHGGGRS